jgi:hypothetical protein
MRMRVIFQGGPAVGIIWLNAHNTLIFVAQDRKLSLGLNA